MKISYSEDNNNNDDDNDDNNDDDNNDDSNNDTKNDTIFRFRPRFDCIRRRYNSYYILWFTNVGFI